MFYPAIKTEPDPGNTTPFITDGDCFLLNNLSNISKYSGN
jgi:hypothetical protein